MCLSLHIYVAVRTLYFDSHEHTLYNKAWLLQITLLSVCHLMTAVYRLLTGSGKLHGYNMTITYLYSCEGAGTIRFVNLITTVVDYFLSLMGSEHYISVMWCHTS